MRIPAVLLFFVVALVACGNPFTDAGSTQGPRALAATLGVGRAQASWRTVLGARDYEWQLSTDPGFPAATTQTVASGPQTLEGLDPETTYHLRVRAVLNNGPTGWSSVTFSTPVWTWSRPTVALGTHEYTDTQTVDVGQGAPVTVVTTYEKTLERHESLSFGSGGLVWATWVRTSTRLKGASEVVTEDATPDRRTGAWTQRWSTFVVGTEAHTTAFDEERGSLTLDGATESWALVR